MTDQSRLSAEEIGPVEMHKVLVAVERFRTVEEALWHADRYGTLARERLHKLSYHISYSTAYERDAYNFARLAHNGWRALRGL